MSRIGRSPVPLPKNVTLKVEKGNRIVVSGPKGTLEQSIHPALAVTQEDGHVLVTRPTDSRDHRAQHGLARSLIANMVTGVTTGFTRRLEVHGVGYRAEKQGNNLVLQVGKSHPVVITPDGQGVAFEVDRDGRGFVISGVDKCEVGQLAAVVRKERPPEPYKGKGIRYAGETVKIKAGKSGKGAKGR
ncbi:MAG: 50S ribosomal protein L6 [Caldilineaceae bacterium]|nr:50S ribosomal protein L6 [Caldilineaceae bacterium]